jgi:hypothetical protein
MIRSAFSLQRLYSFDLLWWCLIFEMSRDSSAWSEFLQFWEQKYLFDCSLYRCFDCWFTYSFILDTTRSDRSKRRRWRQAHLLIDRVQSARCEHWLPHHRTSVSICDWTASIWILVSRSDKREQRWSLDQW